MNKTLIAQQGDTLYFKTECLPDDLQLQEGNIIQSGEATNHHHRLHAGQIFINPKTNIKYLRLAHSSPVTHEEHHPLDLPPGDYEVGIVKEADWINNMVRQVAD